MMNNKSLLLKAISIILIFSIWTSQAYNALVKRKDRYLPFVENANNINKFNGALMELDKLEESGKIQAWKLK